MERGNTPRPFSLPLFGLITQQWGAWKRGISPTRLPAGYNGQNPRLLRAFAVLDQAEADAHQEARDEAKRKAEAAQRQQARRYGPR